RYNVLAAASLTGLMMSFTVATRGADFTEVRLSDRVLVLMHAPWQETMTVIDAGPSLLVVDTWGSLEAARKAKARIDSIFGKPVRYVVNTHHHWDHTFGNAAFPESEIVGHRFGARDMRADYADAEERKNYFKRNASTTSYQSLREYIADVGKETSEKAFRLFFPNRLSGERDTLRVGDLTVLLYHTPGIHTRSNLTVFIPELGIVIGRREFVDGTSLKLEPGADPAVIARVLEEIVASGKTIRYLIPGHGRPIESPDLKVALEWLKGTGSKNK
ncbi:MAG TPA: MBL fold metallo-hydrolase, partial [bacterium]